MPEVSRFFGIVIRMYYDEHNPPHFHAEYNGQKVQISIEPIYVIKGKLPRRALSLVLEWVALHQTELLANWDRARSERELLWIEPLD